MLAQKIKELYELAPHVAQICQPLKSVDVDGFFYVRRFPDHTFLDVTSNPSYAEHTLRKIQASAFSLGTMVDHYWMEPGAVLWDLNPEDEVNQDGKKYFSCGSGLTLCEAHASGYREICGFYSLDPQRNLSQSYLQHIEFFKKFKNYFVEKAEPLIQSTQSMIQAPQVNDLISSREFHERVVPLQKKLATLEARFSEVNFVPLSQREFQCLSLIAQGKSSREAAEVLELSQRTVENYIANIKSKWHCSKTAELIRLATGMGLLSKGAN